MIRDCRAADGIEAELRRAGHMHIHLRRIAERLVDLVMKDQRQAGEAQQQQKDGRDKAGPFVVSDQMRAVRAFRGSILLYSPGRNSQCRPRQAGDDIG
jgi:hypothetical protein